MMNPFVLFVVLLCSDATAKAKVIDPDSVVIVPWTVFIFFLTVYNAFVIPFRASFGFVNQNLGFFFFFDLFGDVCFLLDIVLNFRKVSKHVLDFASKVSLTLYSPLGRMSRDFIGMV